MLARMWKRRKSFALLMGMQVCAATVESRMEFPHKIKNGYAFWPSYPSPGKVSEGTENPNLNEHKQPYICWSVIYNLQDMEAAQVPISRWVDKTTMGHLHNGILLCHKKEENLTLSTVWMDLENVMLSEITSQRKTNTIWFHLYVESNEQTELTSKIETDS